MFGIGESDNDAINIFILEQLAIVAVGCALLLRLPFHACTNLGEMTGVDVAQRDDVDPVEHFQKPVDVLAALVTDADETKADAIARRRGLRVAENARRNDRRQRQAGRSADRRG